MNARVSRSEPSALLLAIKDREHWLKNPGVASCRCLERNVDVVKVLLEAGAEVTAEAVEAAAKYPDKCLELELR